MSSRPSLESPAGKDTSRRSARGGSGPSRIVGGLSRIIWPPVSLVTGLEVSGPGVLEPEYWRELDFLGGQGCARCGLPFEISVDPGQACGACLARSPAFDRARAALVYGDVSRKIILSLKHQGRRDGLSTLAGWMASAGGELLSDADLIVPVPLHYFRLVRRGFNQSVWLAAALGRRTGVPVRLGLLKRIRSTPSQAGQSATGRRRNVQGAFKVPKRARKRIEGRRILLVDDVFTTGATAEACATALKKGGAAFVDVLTIARVVAPRPTPI